MITTTPVTGTQRARNSSFREPDEVESFEWDGAETSEAARIKLTTAKKRPERIPQRTAERPNSAKEAKMP